MVGFNPADLADMIEMHALAIESDSTMYSEKRQFKRRCWWWRLICLLAWLCGVALPSANLIGVAWGQPAETASEVTTTNGAPADDGEKAVLKPEEVDALLAKRYEQIYVPEQDLGQLWSVREGVLVDVGAFTKLLAAAEQVGERAEATPAGFLLEQVEYTGEIRGDLLHLQARCRLTKFAPGWARFPLPLHNVSIRRALLNNQPAPLGLEGDPAQVILLDRFTGTQELELQLTTPVERVGTDELVSFSVFPEQAGVLQMTIPAGRVLRVNGQLLEDALPAREARDVRVPVGGQSTVQLQFSDSAGEALEESLVFATTEYGVGIERDSANWEAQCHLTLFGKRFQRLEFVVPNALEMTHVEAPGLQAWELLDDPDSPEQTRIVLNFRESLPERITVRLRGVQLLETPEHWRLAPLQLLGATSHVGGLAVAVPSRLRMKMLSSAGIRPATRTWKPAADFLQNRPLQFLELWDEAFVLELSVTETGQEVQSAVSHVLAIEETETRLSAVLTLQTLFSPLFEISAVIPEGWRVSRMTHQNGEVEWQAGSGPGQARELSIPLSPALQPGESRTLWITLQRITEEGMFQAEVQEFPLPAVELPGIRILEGTYTITASPLLDVIPVSTRGLDPALLGLPNERYGFRYQDSEIDGLLQVRRKPARFRVSTVQTCWPEEQQLQSRSRMTLDITGGGLRQLQVLVRETDDLSAEFECLDEPRITEQRRESAPQGTLWTLTFDRFVTGRLQLALQLTLSRLAEAGNVPRISFPEAELQEMTLVFAASPEQELSVNATGEDEAFLEPLDPADLPRLTIPARLRVISGYRVTPHDALISLGSARYESRSVPAAIASQLWLTTLLQESGEYRQQADLRFRAAGVRSLEVELPAGAELWTTLLDGVPVPVRQSPHGFQIPLSMPVPVVTPLPQPRAGAAAQNLPAEIPRPIPPVFPFPGDRVVTVVYGMPQGKPGLQPFTRQTVPAPVFWAIAGGSGERTPLQVLEFDWSVHHAPATYITTRDKGIQRRQASEPASLLSRYLDSLRARSWGSLGGGLLSGLLACFLVAAIGYGIVVCCRSCCRASTPTRWKWLSVLAATGLLAVGLLWLFMPTVKVPRGMDSFPRIVSSPAQSEDFESIYELPMEESELDSLNRFASPMVPSYAATEQAQSSRAATEKAESLGRRRSGAVPQIDSPFEAKDGAPARGADRESFGPPTGETSAPAFDDLAQSQSGSESSDKQMALPESVQPPVIKEPEQAARAAKSGHPQDGVLSLGFQLGVPADWNVTQLRSVGPQSAEGLVVEYQSGEVVNRLRWLLMMAGSLVFWLLRRASLTVRAAWGTLLPGGALALLGIVTPLWLPAVEGLLLATFIGWTLWFLLWLGRICRSGLGCCAGLTRLPSRSATAGLVLAAVLTGGPLADLVQAQATKPDRSAGTPLQNAAPAPAAEKTPAEKTTTEKIPLVFPYTDAERPTAVERVFVPREEYLRLWRTANPDALPLPAPRDWQLREAVYVAEWQPASEPAAAVAAAEDADAVGEATPKPQRARQGTILLRGRYLLEQFHTGTRIVPLPIRNVVTERIEINGQATSSTALDQGQIAVVLPGRGTHLIDATFRLPAETIGSAGQFSLKLEPVPSGSLAFRLPLEQSLVRVNEGRVPFELTERENATFAEFAIGPGGDWQIAWQPQVSSTRLEFLSCDSAREVLVRDRGAELQYVFDYRIAQGSFSEVRFQLPEGVKMKTLSGPDLAGWQLEPDNRLRVLLKAAIEERTRLTLTFFVPLDIAAEEVSFALPDVEPLGVTREIGSWAIAWEDSLRGRFTDTEGVRQLQVQQFERLAETPLVKQPQRVYRFTGRPQQIVLGLSRRQPTSRVTQCTLVDVQPHRTHLALLAEVHLEGQPRLSLELTLPHNLNPVEVNAPQLDDWFIQPGNEEQLPVLTLLFNGPQQGRLNLFLRGITQREIGDSATLALVLPRLLDTGETTHHLGVGTAETLALTVETPAGWQGVPPERLPAPLRQMAQFPIRYGATSRLSEPPPIPLQLRRQQARVKGNSVTLLAVTEASIDYGLSLDWHVTSAATDLFYLSGPTWLADRLEFAAEPIRQVSTRPLGADRVLWIIQAKRPQAERFFINGVVSLPLPDDRRVWMPQLRFESGPPDEAGESTPVESQGHYGVLVNLGREPLEPLQSLASLQVDPRELPIQIPGEMVQQAMEILRIRGTGVPGWELKRLERQESPPATIPRAELITVMDGAGFWRTQAVYHVKNYQRQFLPLRLPAGTRLLSALVSERPTRVVQRQVNEQEITLVPLPATGAAAPAFPVRVLFEGKLETPFTPRWGTRRVSLPSPHVLSREESEEYGVPVQHTTWQLSTPQDLHIRLVTDQGTNMTVSSQQEFQRLEAHRTLQEMLELSRIAAASGNSRQQRLQAAYNLRELAGQGSNGRELDRFKLQLDRLSSDKDGQQSRMVQELQENFSRLEREQSQLAGVVTNGIALEGGSRQTLGRAYILEQNTGIALKNSIQQVPPGAAPSAADPAPGIDGSEFYSRIRTPSQLADESGKASRRDQQRSVEDRRLLLEENWRQNNALGLQFLQESQQAPPAAKPQPPESTLRSTPADAQRKRTQERSQEQHDSFNPFGRSSASPAEMAPSDIVRYPAAAEVSVASVESSGLSLPVELPLLDQFHLFAKVGGNPELTVEVRPREFLQTLWGLLWVVLVGVGVLWLLPRVPRFARGERLPVLAATLLLGGVLLFALLPGSLGWLGLIPASLAGFIRPWGKQRNAA